MWPEWLFGASPSYKGHYGLQSAFDFNSLATYNAEVARGIVHTDDWKQKMAALQAAFNRYMGGMQGAVQPEEGK